MKALILNGARRGEESLNSIQDITVKLLEDKGYKVQSLMLNELEVGSCIGCFGCWVKTPGICVIDDDGRDIARAVIQSDLAIYLTPIVFGGPSSEFKKALDRIIPLILPFFKKKKGEIHHEPRYKKYPSIVVLGVLPEKDDEMEEVFKKLIYRNSLNWYNPQYTGNILYYKSNENKIENTISNLLETAGVKAC